MVELLPMIGGGIFGAIVKLFSMSMQYKAEQQKMLLQLTIQQQNNYKEMNLMELENEGFAFTRRIIAFAITFIVVVVSLGALLNPDVQVNVLQTVQTGGSYLFGLVDTRVTTETWEQLRGIVVLPAVTDSFQALIGAYFGASIAKGRK